MVGHNRQAANSGQQVATHEVTRLVGSHPQTHISWGVMAVVPRWWMNGVLCGSGLLPTASQPNNNIDAGWLLCSRSEWLHHHAAMCCCTGAARSCCCSLAPVMMCVWRACVDSCSLGPQRPRCCSHELFAAEPVVCTTTHPHLLHTTYTSVLGQHTARHI